MNFTEAYSRSSLLPFCSARTHVSQLFPQIFSRKTAVNGDRNCCRLDASPVLAASLRWEGATVWVPSNLFFFQKEKKKESGWIGTLWWRSGLAHGRPWVLHPQHKGKNKKLLRRSVSHSGFVVFGSKGCLYCPGWPRTHDPPASASRIQPTVSRDQPALSLSGTGEVKRLPEVQSDPLLHPERGSASTRLGRNTAIRLLY